VGSKADKFDGWFRQLTPLFLLGLAGVVLFEPVLPYGDWLRFHLGEDIVLKVAVVFLILYVLLLWGETLRLQGLLTGLLEAFKTFGREREAEARGGAPRGKGSNNPKARLEAAKLLIAALRSDDPEIVATSHHNLVRLVGEDLGKDAAAWERWLKSK